MKKSKKACANDLLNAVATPLEPPDLERCQALIHNGANFMTMGGRPAYNRCTKKPKFIATETSPGEDGRIGSMSVCEICADELNKQLPGAATLHEIGPEDFVTEATDKKLVGDAPAS
jgi:hypothetical protein